MIDYREHRKSLGLSMQDLSNLTDVSIPMIERFEKGESVGERISRKLKMALGVKDEQDNIKD